MPVILSKEVLDIMAEIGEPAYQGVSYPSMLVLMAKQLIALRELRETINILTTAQTSVLEDVRDELRKPSRILRKDGRG